MCIYRQQSNRSFTPTDSQGSWWPSRFVAWVHSNTIFPQIRAAASQVLTSGSTSVQLLSCGNNRRHGGSLRLNLIKWETLGVFCCFCSRELDREADGPRVGSEEPTDLPLLSVTQRIKGYTAAALMCAGAFFLWIYSNPQWWKCGPTRGFERSVNPFKDWNIPVWKERLLLTSLSRSTLSLWTSAAFLINKQLFMDTVHVCV